ncbi:RNA 2'-phosphotransferase [Halarchaeum sp. P4]|uniref:RNA 2'-phosphotransferase n=1 Tax=Halarchaeum sp. P4 TaxID=3421639 RepID=UPI003EBDD6B4
MLRVCDDHGYFDGETCPDCGACGDAVLVEERRTRLSKFVSGALRHFPDDAGISLDDAGWCDFDDLVDAVHRKYDWATREHVAAVVATDPKGRFEREGGQVRAAYGHSVDVTLDATADATPDVLYHGTAPRNADAIAAEGLKPMGRQHVHLSETREDAREVGRRHTDGDTGPVVFAVDAAGLRDAGYTVSKRGDATYTVARVPPEYLDRED